MSSNTVNLPPDFPALVDSILQLAEQRLQEKSRTGFKYSYDYNVGTSAFAQLIDHTILKPETTETQVERICEEAKYWGFKTVCVNPHHVSLSARLLNDTNVLVCSVVCFPEGTQSTFLKLEQGKEAVASGASELDYVINWPLLKAHSYAALDEELHAITSLFPSSPTTAHPTLKLILETSQLERRDVVAGTLLAARAGFHFVKTSTGFVGGGATVENVALMREVCDVLGEGEGLVERVFGGGEVRRRIVRVKASGGIRTAEDAKRMVEAGAGRLGLSGSVAIMEEGLRAAKS